MAKITVVGIGPGNYEDMTPSARKAIEDAQLVAGYKTYISLIEELIQDKEVIGTGMTQEVDRCKAAVEAAQAGKDTVVVSSGDAGIYGMAGLVLELVLQLPQDKRPQWGGVVAGVSAVQASASILGAPLMHDFAVISLSDWMTPWELIQKRARLAGEGDFVIALYNPKSKHRPDYIYKIQEILLESRKGDTPVGIVTSATREKQQVVISDLAHFTEEEIGMFSLVVIGNSNTYVQDGFMVTSRGYKLPEAE